MPSAGSSGATHPIVEAIASGKAPIQVRLSAARGVLPLSRQDLLHILVVLLYDDSEEVAQQARTSLEGQSQQDILQILADSATPVPVLHHFGAGEDAQPEYRDAVLGNPSTSSETLVAIAPSLTRAQIDDLITRQVRLIEAPELLDLLAANPESTQAHRMRFDEIRRHFLGQPAPPGAPAAVEEPLEEIPVDVPGAAPEGVVEAAGPAVAADAEAGPAPLPGTGTEGPEDPAQAKIGRLTTAEKVKLASSATKEERAILIKDSSKMVQKAVMDSPKLTEQEVEKIARMRAVSEEILRLISRNRDWMKNYLVVHSLATNPKTPIGIAMALIGRLNKKDLKLASVDRNISDAIRRQARRLIQKRNAQ